MMIISEYVMNKKPFLLLTRLGFTLGITIKKADTGSSKSTCGLDYTQGKSRP